MQTFALEITLFLGILVLIYLALLRPWQLRGGASEVEIKRAMPGNAIVDQPSFDATRAVTKRCRSDTNQPGWQARALD
jgi:hypothetical protein